METVTCEVYDGKTKLGDLLQSGLLYQKNSTVSNARNEVKSLLSMPPTTKNDLVMQSPNLEVVSLGTDQESRPRLEYDDGFNPLGLPVMVFESPSTSSNSTSFKNGSRYLVHDYPPAPAQYWSVMRPIRYAALAGDSVLVWTKNSLPTGLIEHWEEAIPGFVKPNFICDEGDNGFDLLKQANANPDLVVHCYLPLEQIPEQNHVVHPSVHYYVAGKNAIPEMTAHSPKHYADTKAVRPCVVKVTHAMGSLGIFVIRDDDDEKELLNFLEKTGQPDIAVTEFIEIERNLACHFFVHPSGEVVWFGYSENEKLAGGGWSSDSRFENDKQTEMRELLWPYTMDVAKYFLSKGFWGFAGIDVLFGGWLRC
ncbi:hypothetical protein TrLO_g12802 [Triparma laevis f. longispina]|uniref:ATP-grasp domain-containing protein n=1 Tax=Triparma laevis f. longispina TaxID=1714387 RepID=A0A9W7DTC2_9STRA|nr:hypothetical protein TrLO_g12802 [Triparma laevis f. longispina]